MNNEYINRKQLGWVLLVVALLIVLSGYAYTSSIDMDKTRHRVIFSGFTLLLVALYLLLKERYSRFGVHGGIGDEVETYFGKLIKARKTSVQRNPAYEYAGLLQVCILLIMISAIRDVYVYGYNLFHTVGVFSDPSAIVDYLIRTKSFCITSECTTYFVLVITNILTMVALLMYLYQKREVLIYGLIFMSVVNLLPMFLHFDFGLLVNSVYGSKLLPYEFLNFFVGIVDYEFLAIANSFAALVVLVLIFNDDYYRCRFNE